MRKSLLLVLLLTCLQIGCLTEDVKAQVSCRIISIDHPKEVIGGRRFTLKVSVDYSFPYYTYSLRIKVLADAFRSQFNDADTVGLSKSVDVAGPGTQLLDVEITTPSFSKQWELWVYACYTRPQLSSWYYLKEEGIRSFSVLLYTKSRVWVTTLPAEAARYAKIGGSGECDAGSFVTLKVSQEVQGPSDTRYLFVSWIVEGRRYYTASHSLYAERREVTVTAEFKVQYLLIVKSMFGDPQGSGWYDEGSFASFEVHSPLPAGFGARQVFERWSGDSTSTTASSTILMDSPKTVIAVWRTDRTILYLVVSGVLLGSLVTGGLIIRSTRRGKVAAPAAPPMGVVHHEAAPSGVPSKPVPEAAPAVKQVKEVKEIPVPKILSITEIVSSLDERVFTYIVEHQGEISLSQASRDLGVSVDELKAAIDRLRSQGRLA
jgi:hypothetical protein